MPFRTAARVRECISPMGVRFVCTHVFDTRVRRVVPSHAVGARAGRGARGGCAPPAVRGRGAADGLARAERRAAAPVCGPRGVGGAAKCARPGHARARPAAAAGPAAAHDGGRAAQEAARGVDEPVLVRDQVALPAVVPAQGRRCAGAGHEPGPLRREGLGRAAAF